MSRKSLPVVLNPAELLRMEQWIRAGSTPQQVVLRAHIIVAAARGQPDEQITRFLKVQRRTVALWRQRVRELGIGCVWEMRPGRGRKARYGTEKLTEIVEATLQTKPPGSTHWSTRTLARAQGVSKNTIARLWQEHQLKPHRTKSFKLSRDPKFLEKLTDVVGVYLTPSIWSRSSKVFSRSGMPTPPLLSGRPPWRKSWRKWPEPDNALSKFNPAVRGQDAQRNAWSIKGHTTSFKFQVSRVLEPTLCEFIED